MTRRLIVSLILLPSLILPGLIVPQAVIAATSLPPNNLSELTPGDGDDYILGAGDRLKIDFFSVPEFSTEYQVLPNGTVNLPRVGAVLVKGQSLRQASASVSSRYRAYLTRPIVTISLIAGRPVNVAIAGEINRPGSYGMSSALANNGNSSGGEVPTLTRLLVIADGLTQAADLSQVRVQRKVAGGTKEYVLNLWQLVKAAESSQDIRLQDGDRIYIPATTSINLADAKALTTTNFATKSNRPLRIAVIGEVNRPGPYTIFEGNAAQTAQRSETPNIQAPNVTQALQVAGGITQLADLRSVNIHRLTRSGKTQDIKVNFWELLNSGDVLQDLPLQDGDRIEISRASAVNDKELTIIASSPFSPDRITVNVVGEVKAPGGVSVRPNTPLNQALLAAGGFSDNAKKQSVTLVRLENNGTVSKRDIAINFAEGVSADINPAMRNGDTLIVNKSTIAKVSTGIGSVLNPVSAGLGLLRVLGIIR
jgi:polysaccharide biosynthesis/export protein